MKTDLSQHNFCGLYHLRCLLPDWPGQNKSDTGIYSTVTLSKHRRFHDLLPAAWWEYPLRYRTSSRWLSEWALLVMTGASGFLGQLQQDQMFCVAVVLWAFCAHHSTGCVLLGQLGRVMHREADLAVLRFRGRKQTRTVCWTGPPFPWDCWWLFQWPWG